LVSGWNFHVAGQSAFLCVASTWMMGIEWYFWLENSSFWTVVE